MASYHLAVKAVSRSAGRSATAAAAYRTGTEITDERTGEVHDYTRKGGVEHAELVLPAGAPEWAADRAALWNAAERAETRKNSTVAREFQVALPSELDAAERRDLTMAFACEISNRHRVAVDVAIHAPGREGDNRNHHAHLLLTTRQLGPEGLGVKTRELDQKQSGEVEHWRERWAELQNRALERAGSIERVDHRSNRERGLREPLPQLSRAEYQTERTAKRQALQQKQDYQPVTKAGEQREAVEQRRALREQIETGLEKIRRMSALMVHLAQNMARKLTAEREEKVRQERAAERQKQERLAQERIERQHQRQRDRGHSR